MLAGCELQQLIAAYEAGSSTRQLAKDFNVHRETIMHHLAEAGVACRPNLRKLTDEQVTHAAELYATGLSLANVAAYFDVGADTIRREFNAAGTRLRPRRGWIAEIDVPRKSEHEERLGPTPCL